MKTCAIIVTYNPSIAQFFEYLEVNSKQLDGIIIVDNSENIALKKKLVNSDVLKNIEVISLNSNHGIAYAQNIGIKRVIERNIYDFILFLDQDSMLCADTVDTYIKYYKKIVGQCKVACLGVGATNNKGGRGKGAVEVKQILSSGSFVHTSVFSDVGTMDEGMFIDFVEFDWCWRAIRKGYKIFSILEISLTHTEGESVIRGFGQKLAIPAPVRHYYQYRNFFNLLNKKYVPLGWKIEKSFKMIIKIPVYMIVAKQRIKRIKFIYSGIRDFFYCKVGKYKEMD